MAKLCRSVCGETLGVADPPPARFVTVDECRDLLPAVTLEILGERLEPFGATALDLGDRLADQGHSLRLGRDGEGHRAKFEIGDFLWLKLSLLWGQNEKERPNQLAVEGMQAVAKRHIEIARQAVEDVSALLRDLGQPASPEHRIAKNTEYAKQMIEKSVSHGREITMLATKAGTEAADVLRKRASEGLDEFCDLAKKQTARASAA